MNDNKLQIAVLLVLVSLIVISGLAGAGVSLQEAPSVAGKISVTPVYAPIPLETPRIAVYEDLSVVIDYGTYEIHLADEDNFEVWYIFGVYNTPCDGAFDRGNISYCVLVGDDSLQEFAKEANLW